MDTKNQVVTVLLVILIGALSGVGLLIGIGNAVGVAVNPMAAKVFEIASAQRHINQKLDSMGKAMDLNVMATRLSAIENKLAQLDQSLGGARGPQAALGPAQEDYNKVNAIGAGDSPVVGQKDAPVTIVEFSDFQCPFCARFYPAVKQTLKAYPNKVNLIIKNYPLSFHPNARPSAKLALAANLQGKYIEMVELLLDNGGDVSESKIKEYAKKTGLNFKKLMEDYKNKDAQWEKQIQDEAQLAQNVDVRGTPTFFINGRKTMARDFNGFKAEVDKALAEKK